MVLRIFSNFSKNKNIIGGNISDTTHILNYASNNKIGVDKIHIGVNYNHENIFNRITRRISNLDQFHKASKFSRYDDLNIFFISGVYSYFEKVIYCKLTRLKGNKLFLFRAGIFFEQLNSYSVLRFLFKLMSDGSYIFSIQGEKFNVFKSLGVNNRVKVSPNWTITSAFKIENRIKSWHSHPKCVFIGRFEPSKGIYDIVGLLSRFEASCLTIEICFLGKGILEQYLKELKFTYVTISVKSFNSKFELNELVSCSNYCFLPSRIEGLPNALFDAWEFGLIPFFSNVGCINDYLLNGENGFNWSSEEDVFNLLVELQSDKTRILRMLGNISNFVNSNQSDKILKDLLEI